MPARGPVTGPVFALAGVPARAWGHIHTYMRQIFTIALSIKPLDRSPALFASPDSFSVCYQMYLLLMF